MRRLRGLYRLDDLALIVIQMAAHFALGAWQLLELRGLGAAALAAALAAI